VDIVKVREVPVDEAVGLTLAYDLTGIESGGQKGAVLRRGHVIAAEDIELLRQIGKSVIKILTLDPDEVHEDDAAHELASLVAGDGMKIVMPGESWADLIASQDGLLVVDEARLLALNLLDDVLITTRHDGVPVLAGETIARAKIRGLVVRRAVLDQAGQAAEAAEGAAKVIQVLPYRRMRTAVVITGREVYEGRKKDAFEPLLRLRMEEYGNELTGAEIVPDELEDISQGLLRALDSGADLVLVTGGGSPDDVTAEAVHLVADEVVFHGAPVAPGAMSILAYKGETPILGVPAGLLARTRGFFDLILPRILAGQRPTKADAAAYGHGGLCLRCEVCTFPVCPFGR
jgi:hypothetical protein